MATDVRTALIGLVGNIKGPYQKNIRFFDLLSEIRRCGPKMKESLPYPKISAKTSASINVQKLHKFRGFCTIIHQMDFS